MVSNNSAECVQRFPEAHGLGEHVAKIVGRPSGQPHLMKPSPFPLITAAERMHKADLFAEAGADAITDDMHAIADALITA
ncbi:hypothetical protein [Streptomyces ficellus]|uniref:hypothetical protein n=1 Tax=Streptomyces ficellus TaxID=1977088 RepID=UPI001FCB67AC|nr:hypothetical protein [Streptomyces ficellus]